MLPYLQLFYQINFSINPSAESEIGKYEFNVNEQSKWEKMIKSFFHSEFFSEKLSILLKIEGEIKICIFLKERCSQNEKNKDFHKNQNDLIVNCLKSLLVCCKNFEIKEIAIVLDWLGIQNDEAIKENDSKTKRTGLDLWRVNEFYVFSISHILLR